MPFHNPYHFVPVKGGTRTDADDLPIAVFKTGNGGHVTHDRFVSHTGQDKAQLVYSGRLICRLTTEDPIVIGNTRDELEDGSHRVSPFEFPLEGKPVIPASTLRGLIASIAEAASNSALRVLEDRSFSFRVGMQESLSAIGMIVEAEGEDGSKTLKLRPLALPTMQGPRKGAIPLESRYHMMFPTDRTPPLKVYVGNYDQIRAESFVNGLPFRSFSREAPYYCYARLHPRQWTHDHTILPDSYQYRKAGETGPEFLLSQQTTDGRPPILESALPEDEAERQQYTRGILRILGVPGREDIPETKKHELFIPYPEDVEHIPTFPILPEALEQFHKLADERAAARKEAPFLPYEPKGTRRNSAPESTDDRCFRLKDGDLVYFRPNETGEAVAEVAFSAIWRKGAGSSYDYFRHLSPELLPFHKDRQRLTIAEQLFGFVEQWQHGSPADNMPLALASRLRFSFGHLHPSMAGPYYEDEVLLKVLDTPKPPLPAFYFKRRHGSGSYIAKHALNPDDHVPQGRKFYLHRRAQPPGPWRTFAREDNLKQKSRVRPIRDNLAFYFHIDFENLSARELGLLCYAIRPTEAFRHKLGLGKPIGLGKVRIDPIGMFYVDRLARYRNPSLFDESDAPRYHATWSAPGENPQAWPDTYVRERAEAGTGRGNTSQSFETLRQSYRETIDPDIRQALALLGDPASIRYPVHTPQVADATQPREMEQETYRWFVANEGPEGRHQFLQPINRNTQELPSLER
jgi:CRISPR-associated protein (TIGR03986 family)